ncbi:Cobalt-zinc-cadmium resistance protein CzcB [Marinomonas spartinae]|uniref:Cobalt-zinc-cadmium resistance protein CzcB n=1 Tax=Marinomonas spartinae TaxID=1792290 RepID=A0A1A8TVL4_9GAMM|nr:efflux RND transporter periplasmic adaptor subunit [Marinomonas spartinae]SBS37431.1 Cobalt-zinc-cadmium resistance protein CzcB [Marinomonas spartinae]
MALKTKLGPMTAILIVVVIASWLLIGGKGIITAQHDRKKANTLPSTADSTAKAHTQTTSLTSVQAQQLHAQKIDLHLTLSGQTMAGKTVTLHNQYAGKVTSLPVKKGDLVRAGDVLLKVDTRTLKAQLEEARLLVKQRHLELDGITKLNKSNLSSQVKLAESKTLLGTAKSNLKQLEVQFENATITAPFDGVMNTVEVEKGQQLAKDATIGTLVSLNPLHIEVAIPQNKIQHIHLGTKGKVKLDSGYTAMGSVDYISAIANQQSRTIPVELTIANPNQTTPAGITADVDFILDQQHAHAFSAALLTLDKAGHTAVKTLDKNNVVQLLPVTPLKSERDKVWVEGLPDTVTIITVGQGFVKAGDKVAPHFDNETDNAATPQTEQAN